MVIKNEKGEYWVLRILPFVIIPVLLPYKDYYGLMLGGVVSLFLLFKFMRFMTKKTCVLDEEGIEIIWHGFSKKHKWSDLKSIKVWVDKVALEKNEVDYYGKVYISKKPYFLFIQYGLYCTFTPTNIACFYFPTEYALRKGLLRADLCCNEEELLTHLREWNVPFQYESYR